MTGATSAAPHAELTELLHRIQQSDAVALEELFSLLGGRLLGVALRLLPRKEDAEEVVCDVFARVWRSAQKFDSSRGSVLSWMIVMTRSMSLDRIRSAAYAAQERSEPLETWTAVDPGLYVDQAVAVQQNERLRVALSQLPGAQEEVVRLAYFGGLSQTEIAARLGDPLGTVKTRTRLGLSRLRELLDGQV